MLAGPARIARPPRGDGSGRRRPYLGRARPLLGVKRPLLGVKRSLLRWGVGA